MSPPRTIIACLTPPGRGAIATIAVRGPDAWRLVQELFSPRLPDVAEVGSIRLGRIGAAGAEDAVVLSVRAAAPAPWLELHCHGGPEVVRLFSELFVARGAELCTWQQFLRWAGAEPSRAEAQILLAQAQTVRTAGILLDQAHGALADALDKARSALRDRDAAKAKALLEDVLRYAEVGRHLVDPWRIVVAGAPNVGKSSLVNALAGYERSVVSPTPGTTRDVVTTVLAIDGWPVEIADTAGMRTSAESLEGQGIARARDAAAQADLCLWVLDVSAEPVFPIVPLGKTQLVVNKIDLPPAWDAASVTGGVAVSARTGAGIPDLCRIISESLVPDPPPAGAAVPFSSVLIEDLRRAASACAQHNSAEALEVLDVLWAEG